MEVAMAAEVDLVRLERILGDLLKLANSTSGVTVEFLDADNHRFDLQTLPTGDEAFRQRFKMTTGATARGKKASLGFFLASSSSFHAIKSAIGFSWLQKHHVYLRIQRMPFKHGTDLHLMGYWIREHPHLANLDMVDKIINDAWYREGLKTSETAAEFKTLFDSVTTAKNSSLPHGSLSIPISVEKGFIKVRAPGKNDFDVQVLQVYVPRSFRDVATKLNVNYLSRSADRRIPGNLIPFALSKNEPKKFYHQLGLHAKFLHEHRNITIVSVPSGQYVKTSILVDGEENPMTLQQLLQDHPSVDRIYVHHDQNKLNLTIQPDDFSETRDWLDEILPTFPYSPRRYTSNVSDNDSGHRSGGGASYYSTFFPSDSDASYDPSTIATSRPRRPPDTNAWSHGPPISNVFTPAHTAGDFPPLARRSAPDPDFGPPTPSTQTPSIDATSISAMIRDAIAANNAKLQDELAAVRARQAHLDQELINLQSSIQAQAGEIVKGTVEALYHADTPFSTKSDLSDLQNNIVDMIRTLMSQLPSGPPLDATDITSPPRKLRHCDTSSPDPLDDDASTKRKVDSISTTGPDSLATPRERVGG
jgi:hypothetical protein